MCLKRLNYVRGSAAAAILFTITIFIELTREVAEKNGTLGENSDTSLQDFLLKIITVSDNHNIAELFQKYSS
jgi:hypothetical protein